MLIIEKCGFCVHYEPIEGIFGNCKEKKDTTFSSNPKCKKFIFKPKPCEVVQPEWNAGNQLWFEKFGNLFNGMAVPHVHASKPMNCQSKQGEPEKAEWESPLYRRKKKPKKVVVLAEWKKEMGK